MALAPSSVLDRFATYLDHEAAGHRLRAETEGSHFAEGVATAFLTASAAVKSTSSLTSVHAQLKLQLRVAEGLKKHQSSERSRGRLLGAVTVVQEFQRRVMELPGGKR